MHASAAWETTKEDYWVCRSVLDLEVEWLTRVR